VFDGVFKLIFLLALQVDGGVPSPLGIDKLLETSIFIGVPSNAIGETSELL
jgi:hypothetical protein